MILLLVCVCHELAKSLIPTYKWRYEVMEAVNRFIECCEEELVVRKQD